MLTLLTILALVCFFVPVLCCGWFWPAEAFWTPWAVVGFPLLYLNFQRGDDFTKRPRGNSNVLPLGRTFSFLELQPWMNARTSS